MRADFKITLMVAVDVPGKTLEEALAVAKEMKETDLITIKRGVDYNDGNIKVRGVDNGEWIE